MKLEATKRTPGKSNNLRNQGQLPGVVYNKEVNIPVSVELRAFDKAFRKQGMSHIIDLDVDGDNHEVLVKTVQMDKRRRVPLHVDFYEIVRGQTVDVSVPIDYVGTAAGVKEGGQLDIKRREVRISILPRLIPDELELDVTTLNIGDSLHISEVRALLPEEATILDNEELTLITIVPPRVAAEAEEEATEQEEMITPEVITKGKEDEEGEDSE